MFKTTWKSYFKNNEKITWKFTGKIMEFCQSEKVGTLYSQVLQIPIIVSSFPAYRAHDKHDEI